MTSNQGQRDAILEAQVEATLGGHDIGAFETVEDGYQATCKRCGQTSWVGQNGLRHSLLEDACPGRISRDFADFYAILTDVPRDWRIAFAVGVLFGCGVLRFISPRLGVLVLIVVVVVGLAGLWWWRSRASEK